MKKVRCCLMILMMAMGIAWAGIVTAAEQSQIGISPKLKPNGQKWRVGYVEGGPWRDYQTILKGAITNLMDLGWIDNAQLPEIPDQDDTSQLWKWLSEKASSKYIQFVGNAYWSSGWDRKNRENNKAAMIKRLKETGDIDLMLALGTWAGQDLANNDHHTNTVVGSASNPVDTGIVKSRENSGYDHLHAFIAVDRYARQVKLFHQVIGFKKLAMAYENTKEGRSYAGVEEVSRVAKEKGFDIVSCFTKDDIPDKKQAEATVIQCANELAPKVDAFYITLQNGVTPNSLPAILEPMVQRRIPTFSQRGSQEVRYGVLMGFSNKSAMNFEAKTYAETIAKILNGAKPGNLNQKFEVPPRLSINMEAAHRIQWQPPLDVIELADEIYNKIEVPEIPSE